MNERQAATLALIGSAAIILGSLLPWATLTTGFGSVSIAGTHGDGMITLILGALAGLVAFVWFGGQISSGVRTGLGVIAIAILIVSANAATNIANVSGGASSQVGIGIGLFGVLLGACATLISTLRRLDKQKPPPGP